MLSWLLPASGWHSWLAEGTKKRGGVMEIDGGNERERL